MCLKSAELGQGAHVFEQRRSGAGGLMCLKGADLGQGVSCV